MLRGTLFFPLFGVWSSTLTVYSSSASAVWLALDNYYWSWMRWSCWKPNCFLSLALQESRWETSSKPFEIKILKLRNCLKTSLESFAPSGRVVYIRDNAFEMVVRSLVVFLWFPGRTGDGSAASAGDSSRDDTFRSLFSNRLDDFMDSTSGTGDIFTPPLASSRSGTCTNWNSSSKVSVCAPKLGLLEQG